MTKKTKTKKKPRAQRPRAPRLVIVAPPDAPRRRRRAGTLTAKQTRFVAEYLIDLNATRAAKTCGYHPKMAAKLVAESSIRLAIERGQTAQLLAAGVSKARLLQELGRLALVQAPEFFDPDTRDAKHPCDLTADQGACLAGFEVLIKNAAAGDGITDTIHKFKLWDKVKAIELYMKHYGMLIEKIEIKSDVAEARVARLIAARKRTP